MIIADDLFMHDMWMVSMAGTIDNLLFGQTSTIGGCAITLSYLTTQPVSIIIDVLVLAHIISTFDHTNH